MMWLGIILGIIFLYIAYVYKSHTIGDLPTYFPGYTAGATGYHTKHAIGSFILALAAFVYAWFQSAPKKTVAE